MPPSLVIIHYYELLRDCRSCAFSTHRHPYSSGFGGWIHQCYSSWCKSSLNLFWCTLLPNQGWLLESLGQGRWPGFIHDICLASVTVQCSEVLLQFLHSLGKFFGCYWSKVKGVALQYSALDLEIGLGFGIWAWLVSKILTSVLLGLGGLPLVPVSRDILFITLMWAGWFRFDHYPTLPRSFSCSYA